jgi:CheY-like chemotaxis protein
MQAANASEGIEACSRNNLDLLISDIGMPAQDGYEMLERIRKSGKTPTELPAIALTAYAREQDRARAFHSGFQAHLAKPLNVEQLLGTIHSLLQPQVGE